MPPLLDIFRSISVVIPAYNAARSAEGTIRAVAGYLASAQLPHEILVVDDGSTDGTPGLIERLAREPALAPVLKLLRLRENQGKGAAVRRGMLDARMAWALFMDVDHSTTIDHIERFAEAAAGPERPAVIIASRRLGDSRIVRPQHRMRQMLGRTFPYLVRALALPEISDTQCGFKAFREDARRAIFPRQRVERFAFDVELLLLARALEFPIAEVPANWDNPTNSTVRIHRDTFQMLGDLLKMSWRLRAGRRAPDPVLAVEP